MIIELAEDLKPPLDGHELEVVDQICAVRRYGDNVLMGKPRLLRALAECEGLGLRARALLEQVADRQTQKQGLLRLVRRRVRICRIPGEVREDVRGAKVVDIGVAHIRELATMSKTVVLGENRRDAQLAEQMARYYLATIRKDVQGGMTLSCELRGGGGDTTAEEFRGIREEERFCVCVVDTDRAAPGSGCGATARKVLKEAKVGGGRTGVVLMPGRKAENVLPTRVMQKAVAEDPSKLEWIPRLEGLEQTEIGQEVRMYGDLKNGSTWRKMLASREDAVREFRERVAGTVAGLPGTREECVKRRKCMVDGKCECVIVPKFDGLLARAVGELERMTEQKLLEEVQGCVRREWQEVGGEIFSWICAGTKQFV